MNSTSMQIAFASDSRYFYGLAVALTSVLENTSGLQGAAIHVLDGGLSQSERRLLQNKVDNRNMDVRLEFHTFRSQRFHGSHLMRGSALTYARLLLPELLPDIREILYLDVDVYYGLNLGRLWEIELQGNAIAAVPDASIRKLGSDCAWIAPDSPDASKPYFNAGILKIDLQYWRDRSIGANALRIARSEPENCRNWDQTILNFLLKDAVYWLPMEFNTAETAVNAVGRSPSDAQPFNLHYLTNRKPWLQHSTRETFRFWRSFYAAQVSAWPRYALSYRYWANFVWRDLVIGSPIHGPLCSALLHSGAYRMIPGMTAPLLRDQLRVAREMRAFE